MIHTLSHAYVAKKPTMLHLGPRECVTEALIAELGRLLPLDVARGKVVRLKGDEWPSVRFLSRFFLNHQREHLVHGVQLVAEAFDLDKEAMVREVPVKGAAEQAFYTIEMIAEVLGENQDALRGFARMLAFDAVIGSRDRHMHNWGVIEDVLDLRAGRRFAPVFDTARGLFLHFDDRKLKRKLEQGSFISDYADKARPTVGYEGCGQANHFDLIGVLMRKFSGLRSEVRRVVNGFSVTSAAGALRKAGFGRLMSRQRLTAILTLLQHRQEVLQKVCR